MSVSGLKILMLADSRAFHTERFYRQLQKQGCKVLLASLEHGEITHLRLKRMAPYPFLYYPLSALQLKKVISRFKPDLINAHFATSYGLSAALAARSSNVPVALNLWGSDILVAAKRTMLHKYRTAYALEKAAIVFADSRYLLGEAEKLSALKKSKVIPFGVERKYLELGATEKKITSPLKIIVPRPHETIYNNEFVLNALEKPIRQGQVTITFPSWGSLSKRFKTQVEGLGLRNVSLYTKMSRDEFMCFMASHDIYLSAAGSDSSPVSMIEAMALGLIPVAADIKGVAEWLDNNSGLIYERNNSGSLRDVIDRLIARHDDLETMRTNNLKRVKHEAVFEENVAEHIRCMKEIV